MKSAVAWLLSVNGGYVDTAGFLALQGLFTAHVTGNFVTIGAALVYGSSGVLAKLLALPVFGLVVVLTRLLGTAMLHRPALRPRVLLAIQLVLLSVGGGLAIVLGPFHNGDAPAAIVTGMALVAGMAVQNAVQRVHLAGFPPTTLMTGNTTQLALDLVDVLHPRTQQAERAVARTRAARMATTMLCFALGCALAAILFWGVGDWCFAVPPLLVLATFAETILSPDLPAGPAKPAA